MEAPKPENVSPEAYRLAYEAALQATLADRKERADSDSEMFRSVLSSGQAALKSAMLINGGGAVTLLAFIGHLAMENHTLKLVAGFALPLACFVLGVLLASVSAGLTYLVQKSYRWGSKAVGNILNLVVILCVLGANAAFGFGCWLAYEQFSLFGTN